MDRNLDQWATNLLEEGKLCADAYDRATPRARPWYDHRFDWLAGRDRWARWERAVYGTRWLRPGNVDKVLDLCCGDGFFTWCVGTRARMIVGMDRDEAAIAHARLHYANDNTSFFCFDILEVVQHVNYDAVMWWDAIEHFSLPDIHAILSRIVRGIHNSPNGVLVGSTPRKTGRRTNEEHKHEFNSEADLRHLLRQYFAYVDTWLSEWDGRRTQMYFMCRGATNLDENV
jgi:2-polyprenyl-3-methyl-5-hydroxy-6-metoxy-1,4-benzoquinol methylase